VSLLTNFVNELALRNIRAKFINELLKIFVATRNLPRKFLSWKRPYSRMKNSMLGYMSSLIRIYWCKNVMFVLEASTGNCCLSFRDLHTSLSITSVLLLFVVCNVAMFLSVWLQILCFNVLTLSDFLQSPPQRRQIHSTCFRRTDVTSVSAYIVFS